MKGFFNFISIYFNTIKTNNEQILYFYYLIWLYNAFYISKLYSQLQANSKYTICIFEFFNNTIKYSIILKNKI